MSKTDDPTALKEITKSIVIFSDGACSGNPGPGGWACVVALPEGEIIENGGRRDATTNNQMELQAAIEGLKLVKDRPEKVFFYTDSTYVIRGITQWIWAWKSRGWKTAEGEEVMNRDLWETLGSLVSQRVKVSGLTSKTAVSWLYSRGHVGTPGNERCDEIAVAFSQKKYVPLYRGSLVKYEVAIYDVPENTDLPEMKPIQEKKPAYSYLSFLHGKVMRHKVWAGCERRVKGQSGAKFKKAMSAADEPKILSEWGLSAGTPIVDE